MYAVTVSDTSKSSSPSEYAVAQPHACKNSPCVYAVTKSDTSKKHGCISLSSVVLWTATYASSPTTSRSQSFPAPVLRITAAAYYVTAPSATRKHSSSSAVLRIISAVTESITSRI